MLRISTVHSFLLLSSILWCKNTKVCLSFYRLMAIGVNSHVWPPEVKLFSPWPHIWGRKVVMLTGNGSPL